MGFFDKIVNTMKIGDSDERDDDDGYFSEEYEEEPEQDDTLEAEETAPSPAPKNIRTFGKTATKTQEPQKTRRPAMENAVCIIKPVSYSDTLEIVDTFLDNKTVVLNFEGVDMALSQRILDVMVGACYACKGNLQKISNSIFIATPSSVDVSGDLQDNIAGVFETR